jgi:FkbH-like protein
VSVSDGLYGDLAGTLERAASAPLQGIAVALEWPDLDPRLGYRSTAQWTLAAANDIVSEAERSLDRIGAAIAKIAPGVRIAFSFPTLPTPPLFPAPRWQLSEIEIWLQQKLASFSAALAGRPCLAFVHPRRLEEESPVAARFDLKSELLIGFPYSLSHAGALALACVRLLAPCVPKKGIVTDLDDTLWSGIVGEVGPENVSWDFSEHHHLHALYQNLLESLSGQGVLVGVASKNDPTVVEQVFRRTDLLLRSGSIFPLEVHWQAKSASIGRILETWNLSADSVIFVDDSPMELAEVSARYPEMQCLRFPKGDYSATMALLDQLRDLCGKDRISAEDTLRLGSIRRSAGFRIAEKDGGVSDDFLAQADARLAVKFSPALDDNRVLDLVNKTNQFNLNGLRRTMTDWQGKNAQPDGMIALFSYEDRFGPLGKIGVMQGLSRGAVLHVSTWVLSCRAFSRRVEHQCLRVLFDRFDLTEILFDFTPTPRNRPLQDFFESLLGEKPSGGISLLRTTFEARCPALFHRVVLED